MIKALGGIVPHAIEPYLSLLATQGTGGRDYSDLFTLMFQKVQNFAIFTIDTQGKILSWNSASQKLFGYSTNEAVGKSLAILFPDMVKNGHLQKDTEMALKNGQYEHITEALDKNGNKISVKCVVTALWGHDNELKGFSKILEDITLQIDAEKKREEFISLAGHELKNPIASIKAYLQLLEMKLGKRGDTEFAPLITKALLQVDKLTHLIRDILDTSKISLGKLPFHDTQTFFVDIFLKEIVETIQVANPDYKIEVSKMPHVQVTKVDKERLEQVFANLLLNAIKYSPKNKTIYLFAKKEKDDVVITIKDKGIGISKKEQATIFEKYYRGQEAKKIGAGLGLGLHLAQEIIEHYKGEITLQSQKGKGSVFSISLPIYTKSDLINT